MNRTGTAFNAYQIQKDEANIEIFLDRKVQSLQVINYGTTTAYVQGIIPTVPLGQITFKANENGFINQSFSIRFEKMINDNTPPTGCIDGNNLVFLESIYTPICQ